MKSEELIDIKEVSKTLGITNGAVYLRIKAGTFPKGQKIGSARMWTRAELDQWLKEHQEQNLNLTEVI